MDSKKKYWLLLEKSDQTRISQGIDSYGDSTGSTYSYDSLVPNHKNLQSGDWIAIRKENAIVGHGIISRIVDGTMQKTHRRCPNCESTDIRQRSTRSPEWKCGRCAKEFSLPLETSREVVTYAASIASFSPFAEPPDVMSMKACSLTGNGRTSQLSMMQLNPAKLERLLGTSELGTEEQPKNGLAGYEQQGMGLSNEERKAVERRAMDIAMQFYMQHGWTVSDRSSSCPYDILASKQGNQRFIEVKGTTGKGRGVILTHGEVKHVNAHPGQSALLIVSNIQLSRDGGRWNASGGEISTHMDPWTIDPDFLEPTQFMYAPYP